MGDKRLKGHKESKHRDQGMRVRVDEGFRGLDTERGVKRMRGQNPLFGSD